MGTCLPFSYVPSVSSGYGYYVILFFKVGIVKGAFSSYTLLDDTVLLLLPGFFSTGIASPSSFSAADPTLPASEAFLLWRPLLLA